MNYDEAIELLESQSNPENVEGMKRFGISTKTALGLRKPQMEAVAKRIGRNHELAQRLWDSGIHEAKHVAAMIDDPKKVTEAQMERWVKDFDSWDVCDDCCGTLFDKTPFAYRKAMEWCKREQEFVKRAGFAMMAELAVHDKAAEDGKFLQFLPAIRMGAIDERNFVKKAVNWALRQIGKRNPALNVRAIALAEEIARLDSRSARWIAADALRELRSEAIQARLKRG